MKLEPKRPPGRPNRKALAFERRSRDFAPKATAAKRSLERLPDAGFTLSLSAVKREVARLRKSAASVVESVGPSAHPFSVLPPTAAPPTPPPRPRHGIRAPGKEIAAAFMDARSPTPSFEQGAPMKVAVINFSGNVGKTTIARHLLAPRIAGAEVIADREHQRRRRPGAAPLRGSQFGELQEYLQTVDNVVVDIGASNVEELLVADAQVPRQPRGLRLLRRSRPSRR